MDEVTGLFCSYSQQA